MISANSRLTVEQKIEALKVLDGGSSERDVANRFSTGKGTINRVTRSQNNLEDLKDDEGNLSAYLKKRKNCVIKPQYEQIENSVVRFLTAARERGMPVTGPMLKSLAERQARKSVIDGFTASEGWSGKVKARHCISGRKLSGEAGAVNKVVIKNWKEDLPGIIAGYDMKYIFNCDETALFFKLPTTKSLLIHGAMVMVISGTNPGFRCSCARPGLERKKRFC